MPQSEQGLPAIEFDKPEEEPRELPRSRGQQRAKRSRPGDGEVSQAGVEAAGKGGNGDNGGGGGEKAMALNGENEDEDGDDFMALPTGGVGLSRSGSNGGSGSVFGGEVRWRTDDTVELVPGQFIVWLYIESPGVVYHEAVAGVRYVCILKVCRSASYNRAFFPGFGLGGLVAVYAR